MPISPEMNLAPQQNPFMGPEQGLNDASTWAHNQATVTLGMQQLKQEQAAQQQKVDEFKYKVNGDMWTGYNKFAGMTKGALKTTLSDQWKDTYSRMNQIHPDTGINPDKADQYIAASQDPEIQANNAALAKSIQDIAADRPDAHRNYILNLTKIMNTQDAATFSKDSFDKIEMFKAMQARGAGYIQGIDKKIDAQQTDKAISTTESALKNDRLVLGSVKRTHDVFDATASGKIVDSKQILNSLNLEKQKVELGGQRLTEGSQERSRSDSYLSGLTGLISKVENKPASADIGAFAKQILGEVDAMRDQYMKNIDISHNALAAGFQEYPKAKNAVDAMFGSVRKDFAKKEMFGEWAGLDQYKIATKANEAAPQAATTSPAKTKAAKLQQAAGVKQKYDAEQNPAVKQAILQRAQKEFDADTLGKVGFGAVQ